MKYKESKKKKAAKVVYPSDCGSHKSMIDKKYAEFNEDDHGFVVCKDGRGSYVTFKKYLDNGLADFYRTVNIESRTDRLDTFKLIVTIPE